MEKLSSHFAWFACEMILHPIDSNLVFIGFCVEEGMNETKSGSFMANWWFILFEMPRIWNAQRIWQPRNSHIIQIKENQIRENGKLNAQQEI